MLSIALTQAVERRETTRKAIASAVGSYTTARRWLAGSADDSAGRINRLMRELDGDARLRVAAALLAGTGLTALPASIPEAELDMNNDGRIDLADLTYSELIGRAHVQRLSETTHEVARDQAIDERETLSILESSNTCRRDHRRTAAIAERLAVHRRHGRR